MKRFLAILLLSCFVMQCFSQLTVIAGFELNHDYIVEHLCVNRDNPEVDCNGSCFLTKELHQNHERKNQENENTGNRIVIILSDPENIYSVPTPPTTNFTSHLFEFTNNHYQYTPLLGLLRPPQHSAA